MEIKFEKINYYLKKENKILDNINLKIQKNTVVGIIGKNGSGKSSILEILSGLIKPNSGKIIIGDLVINKKEQYDKNKLYNKVFYSQTNKIIYKRWNKIYFKTKKFKNNKRKNDNLSWTFRANRRIFK